MCKKCSMMCETCGTSTNKDPTDCRTCYGRSMDNRNPPPDCTCIDHYYFNFEAKKCLECDKSCGNCKNHVYANNNFYCSTCATGKVELRIEEMPYPGEGAFPPGEEPDDDSGIPMRRRRMRR